MAITRTAMTDDDGSSTTGTVFNDAWKTCLYDQIDAALTIVTPTVIALDSTAAPALNAALGTVFYLAATCSDTIAVPTNPVAGQKIVIQHYASQAARTLTLNSCAGGFRFGSSITALTQTCSALTDYIGCVYNSASTYWDVVSYTKGF